MRHRLKYARNAPDGNGTLFRGDMYQVPMGGLLGGNTGHRIWETKLTPQYTVGTRLVLEDGRVFRYAKATNIVSNRHFGLKFWYQTGDGLATTVAQTQAVGDTTIKMADAGAVKDEYLGGYVMIHGTYNQFRGILGNTVTSGGYTIITLDAPLSAIVTSGATFIEVLHNPYNSVRLTAGPSGGLAGDDFSSVAGISFVVTTVADTYIWIQTWGPIWINPHGSSLAAAGALGGERRVVFDVEGSICIEEDAAHGPGAASDDHQLAGFIIPRFASGVSGTELIMLQISP